jgi:hypothetical protein
LVFTTQPSNILAGSKLATVVVTEEDMQGNVVNDSATSVDFTVAACGGSADIGRVTLTNGVGTLNSGESFYGVASGLHIIASTGAISAQSAGFNVATNADMVFANGFESCRL